MILDTGVCTVFRRKDISEPGGKPTYSWEPFYWSWYAERSFETSPAWPTEGRRDMRTDNRIRIHQNREVTEDDAVILEDLESWDARSADSKVYRIQRAYHGLDEDGPVLITDLSLEVMQA